MEYREYRADEVDFDEETGHLHGVAVPLGRETVIGDLTRGGWHEQVAPGAVTKTLREQDIVFLAHHDMHMPLARMSAGNLDIRDEGTEVRYDVDPVDTSYGRDIRALAKAKVLGGVSIGFQPVKDEWRDANGNPSDKYNGTHRILREIRLIEISAVTNPAYKDTSIMARDELLAEREARARTEPESEPEERDDPWHFMGDETREGLVKFLVEAELRASDVNTAARKSLASKGHALPDGSYPIPDIAHLHAAAILAASHHGDWKAAKELIRRRARELGVNADSLPGMGANDGDKPPANRDERLDVALRQLEDGDIEGAKKTLAPEERVQEPESSTPDASDEQMDALRALVAKRSREF